MCPEKWLVLGLYGDVIGAVVVFYQVDDLILMGELVILKVDVEGHALDAVA